jgi:phytoene synthase
MAPFAGLLAVNLETALNHCHRVLCASSSTFASAFRLLPREQRAGMTAFYAFCRLVDDAVDEARSEQQAAEVLALWRRRLQGLTRGAASDPVCLALGWAFERFGIERHHLELILEGVEMDIKPRFFSSFGELYGYCYRVASAVGMVCVSILGERDIHAESYAEYTGIALQLTNIIRDVAEDARRGRVYLPLEDLRDFGICEARLLDHPDRLRSLLAFEAERCRRYYLRAEASLSYWRRHRLFFAEALRVTYLRLLNRLEAEGFPWDARPALARGEKIILAIGHRLHPAAWLRAI